MSEQKYQNSNSVSYTYLSSVSASLSPTSGQGGILNITISNYKEADSYEIQGISGNNEVIISETGSLSSSGETIVRVSCYQSLSFVVNTFYNGKEWASANAGSYSYIKPDYITPSINFVSYDSPAITDGTSIVDLIISCDALVDSRISRVDLFRVDELGTTVIQTFSSTTDENHEIRTSDDVGIGNKNKQVEYYAEFTLKDDTVLITNSISYTYNPVVNLSLSSNSGNGKNIEFIISSYQDDAKAYSIVLSDGSTFASGNLDSSGSTSITKDLFKTTGVKVYSYDANSNLLATSSEIKYTYTKPSVIPGLTLTGESAISQSSYRVYLQLTNYEDYYSYTIGINIYKAAAEDNSILIGSLDESLLDENGGLFDIDLSTEDIRANNVIYVVFELTDGTTISSGQVVYTYVPAVSLSLEEIKNVTENNIKLTISGYDRLAKYYTLNSSTSSNDASLDDFDNKARIELTSNVIYTTAKGSTNYKLATFAEDGTLLARSNAIQFLKEYAKPTLTFADNSTSKAGAARTIDLIVREYESYPSGYSIQVIKNGGVVDAGEFSVIDSSAGFKTIALTLTESNVNESAAIQVQFTMNDAQQTTVLSDTINYTWNPTISLVFEDTLSADILEGSSRTVKVRAYGFEEYYELLESGAELVLLKGSQEDTTARYSLSVDGSYEVITSQLNSQEANGAVSFQVKAVFNSSVSIISNTLTYHFEPAVTALLSKTSGPNRLLKLIVTGYDDLASYCKIARTTNIEEEPNMFSDNKYTLTTGGTTEIAQEVYSDARFRVVTYSEDDIKLADTEGSLIVYKHSVPLLELNANASSSNIVNFTVSNYSDYYDEIESITLIKYHGEEEKQRYSFDKAENSLTGQIQLEIADKGDVLLNFKAEIALTNNYSTLSNAVSYTYNPAVTLAITPEKGGYQEITLTLSGYNSHAYRYIIYPYYDDNQGEEIARGLFNTDGSDVVIKTKTTKTTKYRASVYDSEEGSSANLLCKSNDVVYTYDPVAYNAPSFYLTTNSDLTEQSDYILNFYVENYKNYINQIDSIKIFEYYNIEDSVNEIAVLYQKPISASGSSDLTTEYLEHTYYLNDTNKYLNTKYNYYVEITLIDGRALQSDIVSYTYTPVVYLSLDKTYGGKEPFNITVFGYNDSALKYDLIKNGKLEKEDQYLTIGAGAETVIQVSTNSDAIYQVKIYNTDGNLIATSVEQKYDFIDGIRLFIMSSGIQYTELENNSKTVQLMTTGYKDYLDKISSIRLFKNGNLIERVNEAPGEETYYFSPVELTGLDANKDSNFYVIFDYSDGGTTTTEDTPVVYTYKPTAKLAIEKTTGLAQDNKLTISEYDNNATHYMLYKDNESIGTFTELDTNETIIDIETQENATYYVKLFYGATTVQELTTTNTVEYKLLTIPESFTLKIKSAVNGLYGSEAQGTTKTMYLQLLGYQEFDPSYEYIDNIKLYLNNVSELLDTSIFNIENDIITFEYTADNLELQNSIYLVFEDVLGANVINTISTNTVEYTYIVLPTAPTISLEPQSHYSNNSIEVVINHIDSTHEGFELLTAIEVSQSDAAGQVVQTYRTQDISDSGITRITTNLLSQVYNFQAQLLADNVDSAIWQIPPSNIVSNVLLDKVQLNTPTINLTVNKPIITIEVDCAQASESAAAAIESLLISCNGEQQTVSEIVNNKVTITYNLTTSGIYVFTAQLIARSDSNYTSSEVSTESYTYLLDKLPTPEIRVEPSIGNGQTALIVENYNSINTEDVGSVNIYFDGSIYQSGLALNTTYDLVLGRSGNIQIQLISADKTKFENSELSNSVEYEYEQDPGCNDCTTTCASICQNGCSNTCGGGCFNTCEGGCAINCTNGCYGSCMNN